MAATQVAVERTAQNLAAELALVWGARLGGAADLKPASGGAETGWLITGTASGGAGGQVVVWFQTKTTVSAIRAGLNLEADPTDAAVSELLCDAVTKSAQALLYKSGLEGVTLDPPVATQGLAPVDAAAFDLAIGGKACLVQILVAIGATAALAAAPSSSRRLEAVLDVDLPLIVRFGHATMPLRALAVLGPGSVIDMGRSPDEPVELLVGDRVIARGEVVIVGGNYGVRITELTGSQPVGSELEARAS